MMRQNDGFVSLITSMYRKSDRPERLFTDLLRRPEDRLALPDAGLLARP